MRKVVVIANGFQEEYIYSFVNGLSRVCDEVVLIGGDNYEKSRLSLEVVLFRLRGRHFSGESFVRKLFRSIKYYIQLISYLAKCNINAVHLSWLRFPILDGIVVPLLLKMLGKRIVYTAHNALPHHKDGVYYRLVFKIIYYLADFIIVHTAFIKSQVEKEFKVAKGKILMVEHGLYDVSLTESVTPDYAKQYFQLANQRPVLLFFGKIVYYKGLDILLKSMELEGIHEKFQILIAGRVAPAYQDEFNNLISTYPFHNLTVVSRYLSDREVEICFKAADLTILPYREASQSGVMLMSFSYGVPVLVPDLGSFPEYVNEGKTGLVFSANNWESLAKVLLAYSEKTSQFRSELILNIATNKYSWDDTCETIARLYGN